MKNTCDYERGFFRLSWQELTTRKIHYAKTLALVVVLSSTVSALPADFEDLQPSGSVHGIRAALCALGAAAIVFVNMISTRTPAQPRIDVLTSATGGVLAVLAGVFWFLAETGGDVYPYIRVFILNGVVLLGALLWIVFLGFTMRVEETYQRRRQDEEPSDDPS